MAKKNYTLFDLRTVKANALKYQTLHSEKANLEFDVQHLNFRATLTTIQVFNLAGRFENWWVNDKIRILKLI